MTIEFLLLNFERYYRGEIPREERLTFIDGVSKFWNTTKSEDVVSHIQKLKEFVAHHPPRQRMSRYQAFFTLLAANEKARNFDIVEYRDLSILANALMPFVLKDEWFDYIVIDIFESFENNLTIYPTWTPQKREHLYNEIYWRRGKIIALLWLTRPGFFWPMDSGSPVHQK